MNIFEETLSKLAADKAKNDAIRAGVAMDVAIRLVVFTAAKSLSSAEFAMVRAAIENSGIEDQWPEKSRERRVGAHAVRDVLDSVERSQEAFPK